MHLAAGFLKLGKLSRLVPQPVILGFVNGLAIIIGGSPIGQFKTDSGQWLTGGALLTFSGLVLLSMLIIWGLPKITKAVPGGLAAILAVFGVVTVLGLDTKTVGDLASISGGFPPLHLPDLPLDMDLLRIIAPYPLSPIPI